MMQNVEDILTELIQISGISCKLKQCLVSGE